MGRTMRNLMKAAANNKDLKGSKIFKVAGLALQGNKFLNALKGRKLGTAARDGVRFGKLVKSVRG
jgi:hypothetical protein